MRHSVLKVFWSFYVWLLRFVSWDKNNFPSRPNYSPCLWQDPFVFSTQFPWITRFSYLTDGKMHYFWFWMNIGYCSLSLFLFGCCFFPLASSSFLTRKHCLPVNWMLEKNPLQICEFLPMYCFLLTNILSHEHEPLCSPWIYQSITSVQWAQWLCICPLCALT